MTHTRLLLGLAIASAQLWGATPVGAHGVIATGSGRAGATVAGIVALIGVVVGGLAARRADARIGRDGAIVALVSGLVGMVLGALHLATTTGGFGTGNGRAGAIVALVLGVIGMALGRKALGRPS